MADAVQLLGDSDLDANWLAAEAFLVHGTSFERSLFDALIAATIPTCRRAKEMLARNGRSEVVDVLLEQLGSSQVGASFVAGEFLIAFGERVRGRVEHLVQGLPQGRSREFALRVLSRLDCANTDDEDATGSLT